MKCCAVPLIFFPCASNFPLASTRSVPLVMRLLSDLTPAPKTELRLLLTSEARSEVSPAAARVPVLLSLPAVVSWVLPCAYRTPAFSISPVVFTVSCWALLIWPLLTSMPSAVMVISPAEAPISPALRTPTPLSVPIRRILPAYMPPKLATSTATVGRGLPSAALVLMFWCAAST
ncbi:Uncharacterised protein [Yersinia frederiksenii]|nr:Uncharacterised protein [Yersinia frederiksenii]